MRGLLALLLKESATVAPHWLAILVLLALSATAQLIGTDITLDGLSTRVAGGEVANFIVWLMSFSIGLSVIAPEFRDGQIEFLDSLPTSRTRLFLCKLVAGILPCVAMVLSSFVVDLCIHVMAPGPPGTGLVSTLALAHGVLLSGAAAGLGLGMLLSWIGGLAWGVTMLSLFVGAVTGVLFPPLRVYVPLFGTWGTVEFVSRGPVHSIAPVVVWSLIGVFSVFISYLLFLGPGARLTRRGSWATGGIRVVFGGCLSLMVLSLGAFCALGVVFRAQLWESVQVEHTEHFRVLFREAERQQAERIVDEIDQISTDVGALIGNPNPVQLDVELLGAQENHGGVFTGGKVRLREDADRGVVAHELAHAHAFTITGAAAWHQSSHTRFFDEGLASWVASRMEGNEPIPLFAAAIHAVDPVEFDRLVEDKKFQRERDMAQAYPLGEAFVAALDAHGAQPTRTCVLEGIASFGADRVAGLALWLTIADGCGFELELVIEDMERLLEERAADLPDLPELEAAVTNDAVVVTRWDTLDAEWELLCRFRDDVRSEVTQYVHIKPVEGRCQLPRWRMSGSSFGYQIGFQYGEDVVFDRWLTAPL